jgi:hypothetical protein
VQSPVSWMSGLSLHITPSFSFDPNLVVCTFFFLSFPFDNSSLFCLNNKHLKITERDLRESKKMSSDSCTKIGPGCPPDGSNYSYAPNLVASIIFTVIFSVSLICHTVLGLKTRAWSFLTAYLLGSICEVVGYIGRILLHNNPYSLNM